jgi:hypothetical protein
MAEIQIGTGRRSDEEEARPWDRKDRQGIARAVGIVHNLLHTCHRTREALYCSNRLVMIFLCG